MNSPAVPEFPNPKEPIENVQRTLGLLFTPVGLIVLLCELLGVSQQNTAYVSAASILLTAVILYRNRINRTIPSALLSGLLIGLVAVFYLNYESILFKDTGLVHYYKASNDFLGELGPFLDKAKKEIWFVGTDFHITVADRKQQILAKLRNGITIRILTFDPNSELVPQMARDFDQDPKELSAELTKSFQAC